MNNVSDGTGGSTHSAAISETQWTSLVLPARARAYAAARVEQYTWRPRRIARPWAWDDEVVRGQREYAESHAVLPGHRGSGGQPLILCESSVQHTSAAALDFGSVPL